MIDDILTLGGKQFTNRLLTGTDLADEVTLSAFDHLIDSSNATPADWAAITADLTARDERDRARAVAPLQQLPDALLLETSCMTIEQEVAQVLAWWQERQ